MQTLPVTQARAHMSQLLDEAIRGNPVVLTRNGRPVAVVVPAEFLAIGRTFPTDQSQKEPV
jgi:prevent-host-death family protein